MVLIKSLKINELVPDQEMKNEKKGGLNIDFLKKSN